MGRPLETCELTEEELKYIEHLYAEGASDVEVKAYIYEQRGSFSNDLWNRWLAEESDFSQTIKKGKLLSQAWWERNGRISLCNKDFNYTGWYMNMKNRFKDDWRERQDVAVDHTTKGKEITPAQSRLAEMTDRIKGGNV